MFLWFEGVHIECHGAYSSTKLIGLVGAMSIDITHIPVHPHV